MATIEQIDEFSRFAKHLVEQESAERPLEAIFDRWHEEAFRDEDLLRVQASVEDYDKVERGQTAEEVLAEFRAESNFRPAGTEKGEQTAKLSLANRLPKTIQRSKKLCCTHI